ncbi:MAG: hypothetical protein JSS79_06030 [Bacteroidetes bacterium]|nr:hypothetical protein [Bacteroidota bacterium]
MIENLQEPERNSSEVYRLNTDQINSIAEAFDQIKKGQTISVTQADEEIDEWLGE